MQYRDFGNTGIRVSALGCGGMRIPFDIIDGKNVYNHEKGEAIFRRAFELGVNYVDSAPFYNDGQSEIIIGKALKGWRDKVYVSTKSPIGSDKGDGKAFVERLETSLKKLDTDYIDFYHMWGIGMESYTEYMLTKDGPLQQAFKAKEEGLIKHLSFSFHDSPENLIKLISTGHFETVLLQYNLLDRGNEEGIAYAKEKGLGVAVMGPLAGGKLGYASKAIQDMIPGERISSPEIALRFVLSNPGVSLALSGMDSIEVLEDNVRIVSNENPLTDEEKLNIEKSLEENKKMAELYCTGCKYCMPCPHEVNIPLNFDIMNYHRVYGLTEYARQQYQKIGVESWMNGKKAHECIDCGVCETKCPQKLKIREQLKEVAKVLNV